VPDVNNPDGARSILGINSAYDSQKRASTITSVKFAARKFVMDWAADNKVAICGVHPNATNCRDNYKP
jgi:hypothetical protein